MHCQEIPSLRNGGCAVVIRNKTLKVNSQGTLVCGLHFQGGRRTYDVITPTLFPWMPEWKTVVNDYNKKVTDDYSTKLVCNAELQKPALLTLNLSPISTCSPAAVRRSRQRRRTTESTSYTTTAATCQLSTWDTSLSGLPCSKVASYVHVLLFYKYVHLFYVG